MNGQIEKIIELEKEYGHTIFRDNLRGRDPEEYYRNLTDMFFELVKEEENEGSQFLSQKLKDLIAGGELSPETAAYILASSFPRAVGAPDVLFNFYADMAAICGDVFYAEYHRYHAESELAKFNDMDIDLRQSHFIRDVYAEYYGTVTASPFKGKGAVYTVITGGYDELKDPLHVDPDLDYFFFTDCPEKYTSKVWKIRELPSNGLDSSLLKCRYAKMHPFELLPEYDFTAYVDGKLTILGSITEYINTYARESSMLCCPHPTHRDIAEEAKYIAMLGKWDNDEMQKQIEAYRQEGYNDNNVLIESAFLIRSNHDEKLRQVMETWWHECSTKTGRDQLSFGYACWKNDYKYDISSLNFTSENRWLGLRDHRK